MCWSTNTAIICRCIARRRSSPAKGITLDRSTLCNWVGRACWWLAPLHELVLSTVLASPKVFADDTTLPVLDPGRGRTKTGRLWCYAVDNRPWCGPGHPAAAYVYSEDRKGEHPQAHLRGFRGLLQVDGYAGFGGLVRGNTNDAPQLAFCWAHARRKFYDIHVATKSPLAEEALRRIAELYAIEADIRGTPAENRRSVRQQRSRPLVEAMRTWLTEQLERISGRSTLAQAMRYALNHWNGLILYLDDGRLELDTNTVERAMRPVALGRKNALFAGADSGGRHWAIVATLIQTAKLNDVEPLAWLTDALQRIVARRTKMTRTRLSCCRGTGRLPKTPKRQAALRNGRTKGDLLSLILPQRYHEATRESYVSAPQRLRYIITKHPYTCYIEVKLPRSGDRPEWDDHHHE